MSDATLSAYNIIRQSILSGEFSTGDRLVETELVARCGVSRTPVREALRRLQSEGIVNITPNSGASVAIWTEDEFADLYNVRVNLEGMAASLAAKRRSIEDIETLRQSVDDMSALLDRHSEDANPDEVARENNTFHNAILSAARSRGLMLAASQVMDAPLILRTFRRYTIENLNQSLSQHKDILQAIEVGDPEWAQAAMISHIKRGFQTLVAAPEIVLTEKKYKK